MEIDINGQKLNQTVLVLQDNLGTLYLLAADLKRWRFVEPQLNLAVEHLGEIFYPLSAISDVSHVYDAKQQTLTIQVNPKAFNMTTRNSQYMNLPPASKSGPGGFINYELFASNATETTNTNVSETVQNSGLFEFGYFNSYGVGTTNLLANNTAGTTEMTRLDTTWTSDNPLKMQSLRLGDTNSTPGAWGRSVRFGGIQYGTNFSTQPGFLTYPKQSAIGQAVLPSTVDVFINNSLVSRQSVPPGPFSINNLPIISGSGQVNLRVRDLFGREQYISQPFYASNTLLSKGLENFSLELGVIRDNFGIKSDDYHNWIGSQNYRIGISNLFTGEAHLEIMQNQQTAGLGGDYLVPQIGILSAYLASSHSKSSTDFVASQFDTVNNNFPVNATSTVAYPATGELLLFGIDRLAQPWSMSARAQWTTYGFTQVGQQSAQQSPSNLVSSNINYSNGGYGSISAAYVSQIFRELPSTKILSLSYNVSLGRVGSISVSVLRDMSGDSGSSLFTMFSTALDASTSANVSSISQRGPSSTSVSGNTDNFSTSIQRNLPSGEGYGYFIQSQSEGAHQATYSLQNNVGTYTAGIAQTPGSTATRLDVTGGIALMGDDIFLSRRIEQSFALAKIPDYPNVGVLADNQIVGRTDGNGNALIPRLRAYDSNFISVNQADLPIDAKVQGIKLEVVPYFRSGIEVVFPIEHSHGAVFTIQLEDGTPMPVGSSVQIDTKDTVFRVGYNGEVYVDGLTLNTKLHAIWGTQTCDFEIHYIASSDPQPDLGLIICKEVQN